MSELFCSKTKLKETYELVIISLHLNRISVEGVAIEIIAKLLSRATNFLQLSILFFLLHRRNREIKQLQRSVKTPRKPTRIIFIF